MPAKKRSDPRMPFFDWLEPDVFAVRHNYYSKERERVLMTTSAGGSLNTDLDLMTAVAGKIDTRNDEIRSMLQSFIGRMVSVPPSVWGGVAATRFRDVVDRWNGESAKLHIALQRIAETMRVNERSLREAAESHSHQIGAVATNIAGA